MGTSEQLDFWAGSFGDEYSSRNNSSQLLASNLAFFADILKLIGRCPSSVCELGANIGMNLKAIRLLAPATEITGVEVNANAVKIMQQTEIHAIQSSIEDFVPDRTWSLVFTKGVLIHLNPDELEETYRKLASASEGHVLIAEYFNPTPVELDYRGHTGKLFKRDFGGEFLSLHSEFRVVGTGFLSALGPFPQDNINWWLFSK